MFKYSFTFYVTGSHWRLIKGPCGSGSCRFETPGLAYPGILCSSNPSLLSGLDLTEKLSGPLNTEGELFCFSPDTNCLNCLSLPPPWSCYPVRDQHSGWTRGRSRDEEGHLRSLLACFSQRKVKRVKADYGLWGKADHRWLLIKERDGSCAAVMWSFFFSASRRTILIYPLFIWKEVFFYSIKFLMSFFIICLSCLMVWCEIHSK